MRGGWKFGKPGRMVSGILNSGKMVSGSLNLESLPLTNYSHNYHDSESHKIRNSLVEVELLEMKNKISYQLVKQLQLRIIIETTRLNN